jgi:MFS transporter, ACS family, tartrate transporter
MLAPLDSARAKAFRRLVPLLFLSYVIAYIDRVNVGFAGLNMTKDLKFDNDVFGTGSGVFFLGYFLLEIPGALLVERWSARKWISRIMLTWGVLAAATAFVKTPGHFYAVRFLLGLAEAGFFPGVIVYMSHWFPARDRARALAMFFIAGPIAQIVSPKISNLILPIGTDALVNGITVHHPELMGLEGWQWVFIVWGIPAVVLGVIVLFFMPDHPRHARWLTPEEAFALETELRREREADSGAKHMSVLAALLQPKVILLALAYFFVVTANYGIEFFLPKILESWHGVSSGTISTLIMIPFGAMLVAQLLVGWNSDRTQERWLHASVPILIGAVGLICAPSAKGSLPLTILFFSLTLAGVRSYMPAFWALPNMFLKGAAAAGCIGFINSFGNLGGFVGSKLMGKLETMTGSFAVGLYVLAACVVLAGALILGLAFTQRRSSSV